jgi:hypothetical protein
MLRALALAAGAFVAMLGLAAPASAQQSQRIRCESFDYRPAQCSVPGAIDARIVRTLGGRCIEGQSWGYNRNGVYVNNGCRAEFDVRTNNYGGGGYPGGGYPGGGYPGGGEQLIRCESQNYRPERCAANTQGGVRIQRVIGGSPCRQNQTWGWDRGGVWVNGGCRAEFVVGSNYGGGYPGGGYPGGGYPGGGGGSRSIECSSMNYRPARCATGNARNVQLERVLGGECIEGRTWGYDRSSVWVNDGCRARFRVY